MERPEKAALYARVSTEKQDTDMQKAELKGYCERRQFEIYEIYDEIGVTGSKDSRPELNRLMSDARKRKFDIVLVWKFDRFGRSLRHLVTALDEFRSLGIQFVSYKESVDTSTPIGQAMFAMIGVMAQFERELIRERVIAGMRRAKEKGVKLGRKPKIFDIDKMLDMRRQKISIRKIAKELGVSSSIVHRALKMAEE